MDTGAVVALVIAAFGAGSAWYSLKRDNIQVKKEVKKLNDYYFSVKLYIERELTKISDRCGKRYEANRSEIISLLKLIKNKGDKNENSDSRR